MMKNPCNPVFSNELGYAQFRARFSIWIPSLKTLDGTDFKDDASVIEKMRPMEQAKRVKNQGDKLQTIHEQDATKKTGGIDKNIKAQSGTTAFTYNQKAHKKYSSSKSLVERILKSHSEGNRFIRNEDL